jgi:ectoine hydroxylase-related dioxygenase (phytanoyl-CoA dioxygenase family)
VEKLDRPYALSDAQVQNFRERGFVRLRGVFSPKLLGIYEAEISALVEKLNRNTRPLAERQPYFQAFIQVTNLWTKSESARRFVMSLRCARIAAQLLGTAGVRMWHDQALYKEPGGGITPWHADQFYWPMASEKSVTAWIPLQSTSLDMGPLCFAAGSHLRDYGRDLAISPESEAQIGAVLDEAGLELEETPYELGDVSFHYGWTMHRTRANTTDRMRRAMTMIYMDEDMRLGEPQNPFQEYDRKTWCPGTEIGEVMRSPLNPVVFSEARPS